MRGKVILIPPCITYGDSLSVVGLLYYLLNHYEKVYFHLASKMFGDVEGYFNAFFYNEPMFNSRIFITDDEFSTKKSELLSKI